MIDFTCNDIFYFYFSPTPISVVVFKIIIISKTSQFLKYMPEFFDEDRIAYFIDFVYIYLFLLTNTSLGKGGNYLKFALEMILL